MRNLIGKKLDGRYEIKSFIGAGGMADVYKAYDFSKGCFVAIKILKEKFSNNEELLYRFRNESKANASLSHPNIVRIFDVGFGNKLKYIVMEYIEGVTLKDYIEMAHVLNWKDVVHFTFQVLRGLQHAHDKGIVHRDIKPQNIMLLEDGTVKIMDFGIARFPRDEKINFKKTVGSVHYISPEQAVGGITDFKSDIYSVGIIMYEMLTGKLPFKGETPEDVASQQINYSVPSPLKINPNLPIGLVDIILRATKKNPQERYQSAQEMLRDIDEFKKNPDVVFGYKYLDDIDNTRYFGISESKALKNDILSYSDLLKKDVKRKKKGKMVPILIGVAGGFFLLAVVMIFTFIFGRNRKTVEDIELPNFVGMNLEEIKTIDNGKFKDLTYTVMYEPSSKYGPNVIISQSHKPGTMVKSNYSGLSLVASSGIEKKTIPDVKGLQISQAEEKLKKSGFTNIKKVEKATEQVAQGAVFAIEPKTSKEVPYDTPITLFYNTIEKEGNFVAVPNVIGKKLNDAKRMLEDNGFEVSVKDVFDSDKPFSVVISQNKTKAPVGSTIEIVYNSDENKKQKKFEFNENNDELKSNIGKQGMEGSNSNNNGLIEVIVKSSVKTKDPYHVYVVDSKNTVISEIAYDTNEEATIKFKPDSSKNSVIYRIMIKNDKNGKTAEYGRVYVNESGGVKKKSITCNPSAFYRTIKSNFLDTSNFSDD